jgi:hypothetical protein
MLFLSSLNLSFLRAVLLDQLMPEEEEGDSEAGTEEQDELYGERVTVVDAERKVLK